MRRQSTPGQTHIVPKRNTIQSGFSRAVHSG